MATINKRGRAWYLNWREKGRQHRISLGRISFQDAEAIRRNKEIEIESPRSLAPLFSVYVDDYLHWYAREWPGSYDRVEIAIRCHLKPAFGSVPIDQIEPRQVEGYKHDRLRHVKAATVAKEFRTLKAMLNQAVRWEIIDRLPFPGVSEPKSDDDKPPNWYTSDQLAAIYAVDPAKANIWRLMANTGLRRSEALNLRQASIYAGRLHVLSETGARSKSRKWRDIPLSESGQRACDALMAAQAGEYLLPRMAPRSLSRAFEKAAQRAGVGGTLHDLRHTFCSHLVMNGVPLRTVQVLAGHASFTTTERYAHLAPGYLADTVSLLDL